MLRIPLVEAHQAGWLTRLIYWLFRRRLGRTMTPIKIYGHQPGLLRAYCHMLLSQEAARTVEPALKRLVQVKADMMIGCPF